jgi:glucose/arabinose dehydrogenase
MPQNVLTMNWKIPLKRSLALSQLMGLFFAGALMLRAETYTETALWPEKKFLHPTQWVITPDAKKREIILQQNGLATVVRAADSSQEGKIFADLTGRPRFGQGYEEGLIGMAFHPQFEKNGRVYVYFTVKDPLASVLSEFTVTADGEKLNLHSERVLLEVPQPFVNHNSGNLFFGQDGMLYVALGDGGLRDGPHHLAQNLWSLLGKIIRIDVDQRSGARPYGLPADNPYQEWDGIRGEIYALGLRNPWGFCQDQQTGLMWLADVGQDLFEEINHIKKGKNYGWNYREATHAFIKRTETPPEGAVFEEPIHEYDHTQGISITGGYVYRGKKLPALQGQYLYGDFAFGTLWSLRWAEGEKATAQVIRPQSPGGPFQPAAIYPDRDGEPIILSYDGTIYTLTANP